MKINMRCRFVVLLGVFVAVQMHEVQRAFDFVLVGNHPQSETKVSKSIAGLAKPDDDVLEMVHEADQLFAGTGMRLGIRIFSAEERAIVKRVREADQAKNVELINAKANDLR